MVQHDIIQSQQEHGWGRGTKSHYSVDTLDIKALQHRVRHSLSAPTEHMGEEPLTSGTGAIPAPANNTQTPQSDFALRIPSGPSGPGMLLPPGAVIPGIPSQNKRWECGAAPPGARRRDNAPKTSPHSEPRAQRPHRVLASPAPWRWLLFTKQRPEPRGELVYVQSIEFWLNVSSLFPTGQVF